MLTPSSVTPESVVEEMLPLAGVGPDDLTDHLGSGADQVAIRPPGARAVGSELDERQVQESRERARREGVAHLARFHQQDVPSGPLVSTAVTICRPTATGGPGRGRAGERPGRGEFAPPAAPGGIQPASGQEGAAG